MVDVQLAGKSLSKTLIAASLAVIALGGLTLAYPGDAAAAGEQGGSYADAQGAAYHVATGAALEGGTGLGHGASREDAHGEGGKASYIGTLIGRLATDPDEAVLARIVTDGEVRSGDVVSSGYGAKIAEFGDADEALVELARLRASGARASIDVGLSAAGTEAVLSEGVPVADLEERPVKDYTGYIALIDTGVSGVEGVDCYSVLGGDGSDDNGHGSRMAQVLRAVNPDAKIVSIKALDAAGHGSVASVYAAIEMAVEMNAQVVNLSLYGYMPNGCALVEAAAADVRAAGHMTVGAAGNESSDAAAFVPANAADVLAIGALDDDGALAGFSNYGDSVDGYTQAESTSVAAAKVSGWLSAGDSFDALVASGLVTTMEVNDPHSYGVVADLCEFVTAAVGSGANPAVSLTSPSSATYYKTGTYNIVVKGIKGGNDASVKVTVTNPNMSSSSTTTYSTWSGSSVPKFTSTMSGDTSYIQFFKDTTSVTTGTGCTTQYSKPGKTTWLMSSGAKENSDSRYLYTSGLVRVLMPIGVRSVGSTYYQTTTSTDSATKAWAVMRWVAPKRNGSSVSAGSDANTVTASTSTAASLTNVEDYGNWTTMAGKGLSQSPNASGGTWRALNYTFENHAVGLMTGTDANSKHHRITGATMTVNTAYITYTVAYNANGGTGATAATGHTYGSAANLRANGFSRSGYAFAGWATSQERANAMTVDYANGQSVSNLTATHGATVTLYAVWKPLYTVSYDANGGTGAPAAQTKTHGVNLALSSTVPTKADASYTVTFDANGGSSTGAADDRVSGRVYWTFGSWVGSTGTYSAGATYTANANDTLKASWKQGWAQVTLPTPTRAGYTFKGWATSPAATSGLAAGTSYDGYSNAKALYATWAANTYYVSYRQGTAAGGSYSVDGAVKAYNASFDQPRTYPGTSTIATNNMTRPNSNSATVTVSYDAAGGTTPVASAKTYQQVKYTADGWTTSSGSTSRNYANGAVYGASTTGDLTLYPCFTQEVIHTATVLPEPARWGYAFTGWYDGDAKVGDAGDEYRPTTGSGVDKEVTLKARWSPQIEFSVPTSITYGALADGTLKGPSDGKVYVENIGGCDIELVGLGLSSEKGIVFTGSPAKEGDIDLTATIGGDAVDFADYALGTAGEAVSLPSGKLIVSGDKLYANDLRGRFARLGSIGADETSIGRLTWRFSAVE